MMDKTNLHPQTTFLCPICRVYDRWKNLFIVPCRTCDRLVHLTCAEECSEITFEAAPRTVFLCSDCLAEWEDGRL